MKVFVDECVSFKLMPHLTGHTFVHIRDTSLRGTKNGALLRAVAPDYDVFLTADQNLKHQQNLKKFPLVFVVLRAVSNAVEDFLPLVPTTLAALDEIEQGKASPGDMYEITA